VAGIGARIGAKNFPSVLIQGCGRCALNFVQRVVEVVLLVDAYAPTAVLLNLLKVLARYLVRQVEACTCAPRHMCMRFVRCFELFFAIFSVGLWALVSARIPCQSCLTMPLCCLTKCWGFPLLRRALRREPVHGMGPEWAFVRKKGWRSPIPVVCSRSVIITSPSKLVEESFEFEG
jgi:hypothetical protein